MPAHACLDPAASLNLRVVGALIARERRLTVLPCPSRMHVEHYGGAVPSFVIVFAVLPALGLTRTCSLYIRCCRCRRRRPSTRTCPLCGGLN
jgi:hypothetical protein